MKLAAATISLIFFFGSFGAAWEHSGWGIAVCLIISMLFAVMAFYEPLDVIPEYPDEYYGHNAPEEKAIRDARPRPGTDAPPVPNAPRKPSPKPAATAAYIGPERRSSESSRQIAAVDEKGRPVFFDDLN
jgi:hypothetical protein